MNAKRNSPDTLRGIPRGKQWGERLGHAVAVHAVTAILTLAALATMEGAGFLPPGIAVAATPTSREVNVYSYRQPFLIQPVFDGFQRSTGIKVNVVFSKNGIVERLKREGRNTPADLLLTSDVGRLHDAVQAGVLGNALTPVLRANIPAQYRHPQGLWFGLTLRVRAIFASRERVKPSDLTSYEDLADPKWRGRICSRSSLHPYNVALMAAMISHHGEEKAEQWAAGLLANLARKPQGNDRAQVKAIKSGECDLALVNTYYLGKMLDNPKQVSWAKAVFPFFPNQNSVTGGGSKGSVTYHIARGAHVNISGAGVTRHAPHRAEAIALLEYLSGDEAQRIYAARNHEYPVKPGVPTSPVVASWGTFKADPLPLEEIAKRRGQALRAFDRVGFP